MRCNQHDRCSQAGDGGHEGDVVVADGLVGTVCGAANDPCSLAKQAVVQAAWEHAKLQGTVIGLQSKATYVERGITNRIAACMVIVQKDGFTDISDSSTKGVAHLQPSKQK